MNFNLMSTYEFFIKNLTNFDDYQKAKNTSYRSYLLKSSLKNIQGITKS
jgi:hypothetical protein